MCLLAATVSQTQDLVEALLDIVEHGNAEAAAAMYSNAVDGCKGMQVAFADATGALTQAACAQMDRRTFDRLGTEFNTPERNPVMAALPSAKLGGFQQIEDFVDQRTYLESEFYGELMAPRGGSMVSMMFLPGPYGMLSFGLDQDPSSKFQDAVTTEWIGRQIKRCFELRIKTSAPGYNAILVDTAGRPVGCGGTEIDIKTSGVLTSAGPFEPVTSTDQRHGQEFQSKLENAIAGQPEKLMMAGRGVPYQVVMTPGPRLGPWHVAWIEVQPLQAPEWNEIALMATYNLTPRESSVVMCLLNGLDVDGSCVFSKTQTSGQVELVRRLHGSTHH